MNDSSRKVIVVPCSGIGKPLGSVAREVGYELCDVLRPQATQLVALSKLVLGEEHACDEVRRNPALTIDGCKLMCASKLVKHNGGTIAREATVLDTYRRHRSLKPEGIAELNADGKRLALIMAEEMADTVDQIRSSDTDGG